MIDARPVLCRLHLAHRHLAIALVGVGGGFLKLVPHAAHANLIDVEVESLQLVRIRGGNILHVAVVERKLEVGQSLAHPHVAAVGENRAAARRIRHVVDRHLAHHVRCFVQMSRAKVELAGADFVDHLLAQSERRLLLRDVTLQDCQPMIGPGEDLIIEPDHHDCHSESRPQHGLQHAHQAHTTCLEGRDLVFGRQPAERVQGGDQYCHWQSQRHRERHGQPEELGDHHRRQPFADQLPEMLSDVLQQQDRSERCKGESQRAHMFL